jgi:hypothetical protein
MCRICPHRLTMRIIARLIVLPNMGRDVNYPGYSSLPDN